MRVALYARVSTKQHGQDPETQLLPMRDHAASRGLEISGEYVDLGISGSKERRPQLDRLMADAHKHHFEMVLVARFDRFARSVRHLLTALCEFEELGINFASLNESIDTSSPMGKMIFTVIGAVAELERSIIRERVQAGVDRAKRRGKKLGRPRAQVDEGQMIRLVAEKHSIRSVARSFGISEATLRRLIAARQKAESQPLQKPFAEADVTE